MKDYLSNLKTLVVMQLKDKLDLSFAKSVRSLIIKIVLTILKFVVVAAIFYLLFFVCNLLSVFRPAGRIPDGMLNVIFVLIQLMSVITCTIGLVETLYLASDNRILLALPVNATTIFFSKLVLYYIFEVKKNFSFTLPLFLAYGIINGAVWYYYIWILLGFLIVSLLPVVIGAVLSIPSLFVATFIRRFKWLQAVLALGVAALVTWLIVSVINLIPANINIMGQWGSIFVAIQNFLQTFAKYSTPYYYITLMLVGGTLRISSQLIRGDTMMYLGIMIAVICVLFAISYLLAKPLFVKMASKQFEFEKLTRKPRKNKVHNRKFSPVFESLQMDLRDSKFVFGAFVQLALPAVAVLLLNKLYAAMNTNFSGQLMTKTFNLLIMLLITMSFNNTYANVYSKEANARNILKTRPQSPIYTLVGRISLRVALIILSTVAATVTYLIVSTAERDEIVLMGFITLLVSFSHLLWCAEMDIMHSYADQYATVGVQFDSPNERNATIVGFLLVALFTFMYYFLSDTGTFVSLIKGFVVAVLFTAVRIYLFVTRAKLYFVEN